MLIKKYLSLAFISLFAAIVSIIVPKNAEAAGPPFEGRIYNQFFTQIPASNQSGSALPNVRWCWDVDENGDGNGEEDCTAINNGQVGSRPDQSGWINENTSKYFYFSQANAAGCGPEISNNRMNITNNNTYPGNFTFTRALSPIYNDDGEITGWRAHTSIDDAYRHGGGNLPEYYKVEFAYALSEFYCSSLTLTPDNQNMKSNESKEFKSTVNRAEVSSGWYGVYNLENMDENNNARPVCIHNPTGETLNGCSVQGTKQLVISGEKLNTTQVKKDIAFGDLVVEDKNFNNKMTSKVSVTAFHYSTDGVYAGSRLACIKRINLNRCDSVTPRSLTLSPTNPNTTVEVAGSPADGITAAIFGLYKKVGNGEGQRLCARKADILRNNLQFGDSCGGTGTNELFQIMVPATVIQQGTMNAKARGTFYYDQLDEFMPPTTNVLYTYTAFLTINGQYLNSEAACVGNIQVNVPPQTIARCTSKQAFTLANAPIAQGAEITRGTEFKYTLNIANPNGRQVDVSDTVPTQLTITGILSPASGCSFTATTLTCNDITGTEVSFKVKVKADASGSFTNRATITDVPGNSPSTCEINHVIPTPPATPQCGQACTGTGQGNCASGFVCDSTRSTPICVIPACQGQQCTCTPPTTTVPSCVAKTAWKDVQGNTAGNYQYTQPIPQNTELLGGQQFVYRIAMSNQNSSQYTLVDTLPTQVDFVDATSGCAYNSTTRKVTCTTNVNGVGIRVRVKNTATGTVTNTATVNGSTGSCSIAHTIPAIPTDTPPGPMCMGIRLNSTPNPPQVGSVVNFTCGRVDTATNYEFRYRINNAPNWTPLAAQNGDNNNVSENIAITQPGTYQAQCRTCISGRTCNPWETQ